MVLDPHHRFREHPGGLSINVVDEGHLFQDQLMPFAAAVGDPLQPFHGTAFRLPLRTAYQAQHSRIKNSTTSIDEIRELIQSFGTNELEDVILFLKHIKTIVIKHINASGEERLVGCVSIDQWPSVAIGPFGRCTTWKADTSDPRTRTWSFRQVHHSRSEANATMKKHLGYEMGDLLSIDKLTPTMEVAIPLDGAPIRGSLFTLLPLPVKTGFPLHLNAVFALTPDRQSLKNLEEIGTPSSRERYLLLNLPCHSVLMSLFR